MNKKSIAKNYYFLGIMLAAIVIGCIVGAVWPGATVFEPLGTIFINLMFCIVVPLVFASVSSAIANIKSRKRAGKIMGVTIGTFVITGAMAAVIMIFLMNIYPPVLAPWSEFETMTTDTTDWATLLVNFFTVSDFSGLLSRRAMLPLIIFSILFGFGVNLNGGAESPVGVFLQDLSNAMLKVVKIVTYYAPIAFFGFFSSMVAKYGAETIAGYGRALLLYYPLCLIYMLTFFPLYARFGGGKGAVKIMFKNLLRPAVTSLGTCSSVATIPTNMDVAKETGISKDVSEMVLPLGATMHMDGTCFSCVMKVAFLFGAFGLLPI